MKAWVVVRPTHCADVLCNATGEDQHRTLFMQENNALGAYTTHIFKRNL